MAAFYIFSIVDMRLSDTLNYFSAQDWPTTQGTITQIAVVPAETHLLFLKKTGIQPRIHFRYYAEGKEYLGSRPWLGADTTVYSVNRHGIYSTVYKDQLLTDYINRNYRAGDTVTVYYNQTAPEQAVTEHQDAMSGFWSYWIYRALALFFLLNAIRLIAS
nr:DUF3592 domain-containing protein [Aliamphritea hakodatensis]